jgi:hypothetical protein
VVFALERARASKTGDQADCTRSWLLRRRSKCQQGHGIAANVGAPLERAHQACRRLAHEGARGSTALGLRRTKAATVASRSPESSPHVDDYEFWKTRYKMKAATPLTTQGRRPETMCFQEETEPEPVISRLVAEGQLDDLTSQARTGPPIVADCLIADNDGRRRSLSGYLGQAQAFAAIPARPGSHRDAVRS